MSHGEAVQIVQDAVDSLIATYDTKLIISVSLAIIDPQDKGTELVRLWQYGIRDAMLVLLGETIARTENEAEDFIKGEGNPTITIN